MTEAWEIGICPICRLRGLWVRCARCGTSTYEGDLYVEMRREILLLMIRDLWKICRGS